MGVYRLDRHPERTGARPTTPARAVATPGGQNEKQAAARRLSQAGHDAYAIAAELDVSPSTVRNWLMTPEQAQARRAADVAAKRATRGKSVSVNTVGTLVQAWREHDQLGIGLPASVLLDALDRFVETGRISEAMPPGAGAVQVPLPRRAGPA